MARIFWEHFWGQHTRQWTNPPSLSATGGPFDNGPYALQGNTAAKFVTFPTSYTDLYWAMYYNPDDLGASDWFGFRLGAGSTLATLGLNASQRLVLKVGGTQVGSTGTYNFAVDTWAHIQFRYKIADASGIFEAIVNGVPDVSFAGDTKPGSDAAYDTFLLLQSVTANRFTFIVADDAAYPGQVKFAKRNPTGDSATNNAWTPSTGSTKFPNVDDIPPDDDGTYNFSGTNGQRQGHTHAAHTLPATATVVAAITEVLAKGDASLKTGVRSSSSEVYGTSQTLNSGAYGLVKNRTTTDPNGGGAIALSALNAMETIYETVI